MDKQILTSDDGQGWLDDSDLLTAQAPPEIIFEGERWPERQPLPDDRPRTPALPEDMLPEPLRAYAVDIAEHACLPLEAVAAPFLVAVGAAIGRRLGIKADRKSDYLSVGNLWGALIAGPGTKKSHAIDSAASPLNRCEAEAFEKFKKAKAEAEPRLMQLKAEVKGIEKAIEKAANKGEKTDDLSLKLAAVQGAIQASLPVRTRYIVNDATPEKLGMIENENPHGLLLFRDELTGWIVTTSKQGREGERQFFLEGWNGTGNYSVDRVARGSIYIAAHCLSVLGGLQPGPVEKLVTDASKPGANADGFLQRFQLTVWPTEYPDYHEPTTYPDSNARHAINELFEKIVELDADALGAFEDEHAVAPWLELDADAQDVRSEWIKELEARLRSPEIAKTPAFHAHLGKYRSLHSKLALLFDVVKRMAGTKPMVGKVDIDSVTLAADWCEFLEAHARRLYASELGAEKSAALALVRKIEQGAVADGMTLRDIGRAGWSELLHSDDVLLAAKELESLGWARIEQKETGGRPSPVLRLHPDLRGES